jgi:cyclophilin family peptidyl-prolyl cis-trans isomerase
MRIWMRILPTAIVCVVLLAAISAGCGNSGGAEKTEAAPAAGEKEAEVMTETVAPAGGEATEQLPAGPTATLTYIEGGATKTKQVPYLGAGRKIATIETSKGTIKIELWENKAPNTVVNFVSLANAGRYDNVDFHRVIDGFMAQTGDVERKGGYGGPGYTIPAEFDAKLKHVRGVVSMARSSEPNSGGSQFFIMLGTAASLDGQYAAFGQVIEGMDIVDQLKKGDKANNGAVTEPDRIVKLRVESAPVE